MSGVNNVQLIGNLGSDPEVRQTNGGTQVCNLRLAVGERRKDRDGNWGEHTEWVNIVCFGKTADNVERFCRKGKKLYIEGRLSTRKWQDKTGADRWSTEVVANRVLFLGGKDEGSSGGGGYSGGSSSGGGGGRSGGSGGGYSGGGANGGGGADEDIPF